jgi:nucleoside-diphosphate-sugar epimerase
MIAGMGQVSGSKAEGGEIVVVTGADGPIGRRVVAMSLATAGVSRVVAVGLSTSKRDFLAAAPGAGPELVPAPFALDDPRLVNVLRGATRLIHLGPRQGLEIDGTGGTDVSLVGTRSLLAALADVAEIRDVVVLSSALVYGARAENPVPLTEAAPVRPNPAIKAAVDRSELEKICTAWASTHGTRCVVLRPCVVVAPENGQWLARSPWSTSGLQVSGASTPVQFLHVDDLVWAIACLLHSHFDGVVNVAPDGWLMPKQVRALKGPAARLRLRGSVALLLARIGVRVGLASGDPSTLLASSAPWVVTNDRLRSLGWEPEFTNEEAYVDSDRGGPWARLTPRHRQELALGGVVILALGVLTAGVIVVRRQLRADHQA